jgi:hypothetical protein
LFRGAALCLGSCRRENQAIELPDLRQRLAAVIGGNGFPQICLRLGFGHDIKPTPRRDVVEVLI